MPGPASRRGVGAEDAHVLDQLDAGHRLEDREDLTGLHRPAERPATAIGSAADRVEVLEQRVERRGLDATPAVRGRERSRATTVTPW